jgi:glutamine synthetase
MTEPQPWTGVLGQDVRGVRIEYANLDGVHSGKLLAPGKFTGGVPDGWAFPDLAFGLSLGNDVQFGFDWGRWRGELPDVLLRPDLDTYLAPVGPDGIASVLCDFFEGDGTPLALCPRGTLRRMQTSLAAAGYAAKAACEVEATLFTESFEQARQQGFRELTPLGGSAGAMLVLAKSESYKRYMGDVTARLTLLGVPWEGWSDEAAVGQVEINLAPLPPLEAADAVLRVKQVMREVAAAHGHSVTFMPKWTSAAYGQGLHVNLSLYDGNFRNAFHQADSGGPLDWFVNGLLRTMRAATSFAMPLPTSYRRLAELEGPPTTITWGLDNKSCAVRVVRGTSKTSRIEYRLPGGDANPYLLLAVILAGGLWGLQQHEPAVPAVTGLAWMRPPGSMPMIPATIDAAASALEADVALRGQLGDELVDYWVGTRRWEWLAFHESGAALDAEVSQWELERYFELT